MVGDVLARSGIAVAEEAQHLSDPAVGGGLMGEVAVVPHVRGLDAGDAAQLRIEGQGSKTIVFSVLVE